MQSTGLRLRDRTVRWGSSIVQTGMDLRKHKRLLLVVTLVQERAGKRDSPWQTQACIHMPNLQLELLDEMETEMKWE